LTSVALLLGIDPTAEAIRVFSPSYADIKTSSTGSSSTIFTRSTRTFESDVKVNRVGGSFVIFSTGTIDFGTQVEDGFSVTISFHFSK
jgi:hypothetical protein